MSTTNTIIDKLRASLEVVTDDHGRPLPFIYEDADIQNIVFDQVQPPLIAAVPITSSAIQTTHNMFHERITIAIWFADAMYQNGGDYNATENERIIDACKQRALEWAASLTPATDLQLVSVNEAERAYLERDANLTGYLLNVTLDELTYYGCNG